MKKLIVDFGVENISLVKVDIQGKNTKVISEESFESSKYLNDSGAFDIKRVASAITSKMGKEATALDMEIVLPSYMTKSNYCETAEFNEKKSAKPEEQNKGKLTDKQVVFIGDSGAGSTTQTIYYSKKALKSFVRELYRAKFNVVSAIGQDSANYHSLVAIQEEESSNTPMSKTRVFVSVGITSISCTVIVGNMPVYIKETGYSLYDLYSNLKEQHESLSFAEFMAIYKKASPYNVYKAEEGEVAYISKEGTSAEATKQRETNQIIASSFDESMYEDESDAKTDEPKSLSSDNKIEAAVAREIQTIFDMVCPEIKEVVDYTNNQYGAQTIEVCTNSLTARDYISFQISSIYNINGKVTINEQMTIGDNTIDLTALNKPDLRLMACIGAIVCSMKKGADYYA